MPIPIPLIIAGIQAATAAGGAAIQRGQSKRDIRDQNEYNHPVNQLARLREAGLPYAAYTGGQTGNQSALPTTTDAGIKEGGHAISNYITTETQLKQLEILKEEIRLKRSEADKFNAETEYLLSGAGEDRAGTNLTRSLKTKIGIEQADEKGKQLGNKILAYEAQNKPARLSLENTKLTSDILKLLKDKDLVDKNIEGKEIENDIQSVIRAYKPGMSDAELGKLLKENKLLTKSIEGKGIENAIQGVRYKIESATESSQIYQRDMTAAQAGLTYDRVAAEFQNYNQYHEFVQKVQDEIKRTPWEKIKNPKRTFEAMIALAYTTVTGISGQSPNAGNILQYIK